MGLGAAENIQGVELSHHLCGREGVSGRGHSGWTSGTVSRMHSALRETFQARDEHTQEDGILSLTKEQLDQEFFFFFFLFNFTESL